ncbi:MAG: hypothetical protein A3E57_08235 [Candidatus Muproteobacteria bacterium RIFCSPHIGHO2_12_FULL_60_33]|uniref:Uncharacterized protein n=1 Tax=Candidatus Muproteobacteria bacterium RIFCSPLOWO2_01_FULL_60_18 TaxID=1817768 RepID=A0A1F6U339_9PROT|nr:MAG: hypothetical protein A2W42_00945 [Candidatus Muproteobacteria bacterium RIFCSPHIGHO2_01_60_12]OGI51794.1 MAG: hypothetical protein A3A87_02740 [Candidatus Muproteobacteria bacterium RIFCSPLOWO2_01_FULL_60_18]OGI55020.1 MAG: hypothetical protein A3E57_08235 [Candidatus Muproteobacteria bacterium RIFCSPHIGHO2_12_FULL_60_33]OGI55210.1 MAG: hypothetical protein A3D32_01820 [Candidatus Muproteobacteria bacterium RIFCSPHIGHO2_02_FULL_60_13]OGI58753.1 MAG: hypothetical protein A2809_05795 [Can
METPDPKYKHKPSEKHTLEEVLKSLQDLIRNDLVEGAADTAKPESPPAVSRQPEGATRGATEPQPRRENASSMREDFAPASPGAGPVNLDAVMRSLNDLIGNELNVGDEPKPESEESASTHEEYLSAEVKIEEYVPEESGRLDDVLNIGDKRAPDETESTPPRDELSAPEEIIEASLPEEFTPLDEASTIEEAVEAAPPPPALSGTPELPGEISPELPGESEVTPPPVVPEPPLAMEENIAPGAQHEMFFEETPAPSREPEAAPPDSTPLSVPEPEPVPPTVPEEATHEPAAEKIQVPTETTLPTIEVEESFDQNDYFSVESSSAESPPAASEETIALDMEISAGPKTAPLPVDAAPALPSESPLTPEPPATPVEEKITLEMANEPAQEKPRDEYSVDFDAPDLMPPLPEESELAPPETGMAAESQTPAETAEADSVPAPDSEAAAPPPEPPTVETKAETPAETEPPRQTTDTAAPEAPASFNLDDIPVLNEVVAPPAGSVPTPTAPPPTPPLPAPDRTRDIVVRAVAKLNIEMRKSGSAGLDTRTILRLQQLIRQELEKGGGK